jgi:hypothetical protein
VEQDSSHALVGVDMYDGYTLAPKGQICRTTTRTRFLSLSVVSSLSLVSF